MSLLVNVYTRNDKGEMLFLDPDDHSKSLAGFESFRKTFYGSETAKSLGLCLLPTLAAGDLYTEGADLANLNGEAKLVLQNIDLFTEEANAESDTLRFRIQNIIDATQRAEQARGGVVIW